MSQNQQGQPNQGSSEQGSNKGGSQSKSAPDYPPATPPEKRTNSRNDGVDK
jgi:hypothetical protein